MAHYNPPKLAAKESLMKTRRFLLITILTGLMARLLLIFLLPDYQSPPAYEYGAIADHIVAGQGFAGGAWYVAKAPTAFMAPVYPALLALCKIGFAQYQYLAVQIIQAIIASLSLVPFYLIGRKLLSPQISAISTMMLALYPVAVYQSRLILTASLALSLLIFALYYTLEATEGRRGKAAWLAGLFWGLGLLTEPALIFVMPGLAVVLGYNSWKGAALARLVRPVTIMAVAAGLLTGAWVIRNAIVFQRFIFIKDTTGLNLWQGNNPQATGALYMADGRSIMDALSEAQVAELRAMDELAMDDWFKNQALQFIRDNPGSFIKLYLIKLACFYSPCLPRTMAQVEPGKIGKFHLARSAIYLSLFVAALIGLGLAIAARRNVMLLLAIIVQPAFFYAFFHLDNHRYRYPYECFLIYFAAICILKGYETLRSLAPQRAGTTSSTALSRSEST